MILFSATSSVHRLGPFGLALLAACSGEHGAGDASSREEASGEESSEAAEASGEMAGGAFQSGDPQTSNPGAMGNPGNAGTTDPGSADPGSVDPGSSGDPGTGQAAVSVPSDYPQLTTRFVAHARWAIDHSGFELIPNRVNASVAELSVSEGTEEFGALYDEIYASLLVSFTDRPNNQIIELLLPSFEPGVYDMTDFASELRYTEREGYLYTTQIEGGRGEVEIVENDGKALWGTFSGRVCYVATPGVNCFSIYEGRFSAVVQGGAPGGTGMSGPAPGDPDPEPIDDPSPGPIPPSGPAAPGAPAP